MLVKLYSYLSLTLFCTSCTKGGNLYIVQSVQNKD